MQTSPKTLAGYIPRLIIRRLAVNPALIIEPAAQQLSAAVLFIDMTGGLTLAEPILQLGSTGSEELIDRLKTYFRQVVDLVTAHGGDIIKFSGDELVVVWATEATTEDLATVTLRASQCGLFLLNELHGRSIENISFSLRATVVAGEVVTTDLGGVYGRWEFLLTGPIIAQANKIKREAQPGMVALSPAAWALIQDKCAGRPLTKECARLEAVNELLEPQALPLPSLTAQAEAALRGYLPGALLSLLSATRIGLLTELLPVTILFVTLPDLDYKISLTETQVVVRTLQTILYDHEGSVDKISIDDRGTSLIGVLGLPPLVHTEGNAAFGVQAALIMQEELSQINCSAAIGVTTGRAFCGIVGNQQRSEYAIIGNIVNLAKNLTRTRPKTENKSGDVSILCDQTTYQATPEKFVWDVLPPLTLKDETEPVAVYRPTSSLLPPQQEQDPQNWDNWPDSEIY